MAKDEFFSSSNRNAAAGNSLVCGTIAKKVNKIYIFRSSIKGTYFASADCRYVIFGK
ncbi:hypothetical protein [Sphingobacterium multivorum]|uniref:hypothetical protein n=1 Tax=Sphingobacterium multivorum TaxID=28454 RepID=UPI003DA272E4